MHTKNHTDMMYASWDMECHRHNFLSFWVIFCPFTPLLMPKIKMWKKYLKIQEILSFYKMCTMNEDHMMYDFRDIRCNKHSFLVILGHFLLFNPPNNPKNQNFEKIKKKNAKLLSFYNCVTQMTIIWCMVPETWSVTDRIFCDFGIFFTLLPP